MNELDGYSLFSDVDDTYLQLRNRAVTMCNIVEDHMYEGTLTEQGQYMLMKYWEKTESEGLELAFKIELDRRKLLLGDL